LIHSEKTRAAYGCFIRDISRGGMFIKTPRSFSVGEKISFKFLMPDGLKQYQILGEIVRFQEDGIGIKFKRLLAED
jgi:Tfp pilus assembly protein PilZ